MVQIWASQRCPARLQGHNVVSTRAFFLLLQALYSYEFSLKSGFAEFQVFRSWKQKIISLASWLLRCKCRQISTHSLLYHFLRLLTKQLMTAFLQFMGTFPGTGSEALQALQTARTTKQTLAFPSYLQSTTSIRTARAILLHKPCDQEVMCQISRLAFSV